MNNKLLILGGGFGLYGYLPAAVQTSWQVTTLTRYQSFLENRIELSRFLNQVSFVTEDELDPNFYDAIVVARTPRQQVEFIQSNSSFEGRYFLEKPLGGSLSSTDDLLNILEIRKSHFSVAYLFQYQEWYKEVVSATQQGSKVTIEWKINPGESLSWKNDAEEGGGVLSYYGIHLLALIVDGGFNLQGLEIDHGSDFLKIRSMNSANELDISLWVEEAVGFKVSLQSPKGSYHWSGESPFGKTPTQGVQDPRIPSLIEYLSDRATPEDLRKSIERERRILQLRQTISNGL